MRKKKIENITINVFLWVLSLLIIVPLYIVVINSLKDKASAAKMGLNFPKVFMGIENYSKMIADGGVLVAFKNSLIVTITSVVLIILISSTLAYVLQRRKSKVTNLLLTMIIMGLVFPVQMIPTYFLCNFFKIPNYAAVILVLIAANLSFSVFTYTGYLKGISRQIDEAAIIDGAGPLRIFFQIIFPLLAPITYTNIIIAFMGVWNDFGITIYFLNSSKNYTLPLTIYNFFSTHNSDWQLVFANVVVVSLPVVIVYLFLQKYIISGMTSGSVKG